MPFKALVSIYFYTKMNFILGAADFILSLGNELSFGKWDHISQGGI